MSERRVLLIVGGGIAAYKALALTRLLRKAGVAVRPILTQAGAQFVTPLSLSALAEDKVYSDLFSGVHGNYLRGSIVNSGLDPDSLPAGDKSTMKFGSDGSSKAKAWRDIWGAGQGVGSIDAIEPAAEVVAQLVREYRAAMGRMSA